MQVSQCLETEFCFHRCVLTPGDPYMRMPNDKIIEKVAMQVKNMAKFNS